MSTVIASQVLANGLRTEFSDTYSAFQNRQSSGKLGALMDTVGATNRQHEFAYFEAAPHMEHWQRGNTIPTDAMGSVQFSVPVYNWARRIPWHKDDRKDDQTQSLMQLAQMAGQSAALLEERMFFDLIQASTNTLPAVPTAPDGAAMYAGTAGGAARFGAANGNILTSSGVATVHDIQADYWSAIEQFMAFQDGKGQPLLSSELIDGPVTIIHAAADTEQMEIAFLQKRHAMGIDNAGARGGTVLAAAAETNLVHDSSRNVTLWGSSRLTTGDWFIFLTGAPKKPTFLLDREGVQEFTSLEGDNNGDHTRDTGEEYVQWERRAGAGIAQPFATIKINTT